MGRLEGLRATGSTGHTANRMCEFKVFLSGQLIAEDVVYAKVEGRDLMLRDILGSQTILRGSRIVEVDVNSERLIVSESALP